MTVFQYEAKRTALVKERHAAQMAARESYPRSIQLVNELRTIKLDYQDRLRELDREFMNA